MQQTLGDKIAEVIFTESYQYSEAQILAYKFDKFVKKVLSNKETTIKFLEDVGIYKNGELSDEYK